MMKATPGTNRPEWQLQQSNPERAEAIKAKLNEVMDPELGLSIIQLGLIRDVYFVEDELNIKMILTTPFCPYGPAIIEQTKTKAEEAASGEVKIELAMEPWDFSMMEEGLGGDWGLY